MLSPLSRLLHLKGQFRGAGFVPALSDFLRDQIWGRFRRPSVPATAPKIRVRCNHRKTSALFRRHSMEETRMRKALAILATVATIGATAVTAPAEAGGRGFFGPGLAFGLAAGALTAGAIAGAYGPYYGYGPGYGYGYGPGYGYYGYDYAPAYYGAGPYAYYGGPYYRRYRYWRPYW
jgi:hypothetical protein